MPMQTASSTPDKSHHHNVIPPAVRRQAEAAEKLAEQARQGGKPEGEQAQPEAQEHQEPNQPQAVVEPAAPQPPQEPPQPTVTPDDLEHRLRSEQGRVNRYREDLRAAQEEIQNLHRLLATTRAAPPEQAPTQVERLLTPEEQEEWKELLPIVEKRARELIAPLQAELNSKIEQVNHRLQGLGEVTQVDMRQRMFDALDTSVPGWRDVNVDPAFGEWLSHLDVYTGQPRKDLLMMAYNSNSASRVAAFFEAFLREQGGTPQPAPRTGAQPGNGAAAPAQGQPQRPSLEQFAAPGKARTVAPPAAPAKETISRAQIANFYADVSAGKYRNRQAEKDELEREIFLAEREGRIT